MKDKKFNFIVSIIRISITNLYVFISMYHLIYGINNQLIIAIGAILGCFIFVINFVALDNGLKRYISKD